MLKTLRNIIKAGDSTIAYPFAPYPTVPEMRGKPEHSLERCIACAACAVACPPNAIRMETKVSEGNIEWQINYGACIFCGRCEEVCPVEAIRLGDQFELAVMSKPDLIETCSYELQRCSECGKCFAPKKEVDYACRVLSRLENDEEAENAIRVAGLCTECKERADAYHARTIARSRQEGVH